MTLTKDNAAQPGLFEVLKLYLLLGWRNIWRHPRRSILTFLAIILGLMLFTLTRAIQLGTYEKIIEKAVRTHTGYIQIHANGYMENQSLEYLISSKEHIHAILEQDPEVSLITERINSEALIASDEGTTGTSVIGVDPAKEFKVTTLGAKIKEGTLLKGEGDVIIGERMAKNLKVSVGSEVILIANGADGSLGADRFTVSGIFRTGVAEFDRSVVMIGIQDADLLYSMSGAVTEMVIHLNDFSQVEERTLQLKKMLFSEDVEVHSWKELLPEMVQTITLDNIGGLIMLWFFFIIVVAVILNTILITTLERVKEFGIMMALGLKPSRIFFMISFEAAILVLIGTLIGIALSWTAGSYLEAHPFGLGETVSQMQEEMGFSPLIYTRMSAGLLLSWGSALFVASMVVALYPAFKVARLSPLKAMHPGRGEL